MDIYYVYIRDNQTKEVQKTLCETKDDLAKLLLNFDDDQFRVTKILCFDNASVPYKMFCKQHKNLEKGDT